MAKLLKILGKTVLGILEWLLILIIFLSFAIRTSTFQTFLAGEASDYLSKELGATIRIDEVAITFLDRVVLDKVYVEDLEGDTLLYVKHLNANLSVFDLKNKLIVVDDITLDEGNIEIKKYKGDEKPNFQFIVDYFKKDTESSSDPFEIKTGALELIDVDFSFEDFNTEKKDFGVDFKHLDANNVNLLAENIRLHEGDITLDLKQLKLSERSGLVVEDINSTVAVGPSGLKFDDLKIITPNSNIEAPKLHLLMNGYDDFGYFVDSVTFDSKLNKSEVSIYDVSLFAPTLEGMDHLITLEADVTKKVKNLKLENLALQFGEQSYLKGDFNLPDFRDFKNAFFQERIDDMYMSVEELGEIKLPKSSSTEFLELAQEVKRLIFFKARSVKLDGFYSEFVLTADKLNTALGGGTFHNGIYFNYADSLERFNFNTTKDEFDLKVNDFNLGGFINNDDLGFVNGEFELVGYAKSLKDINFTSIKGEVNKFQYLGYDYSDIAIKSGSFENQKFVGKVDVNDPYLSLTYDGSIDFKGKQAMDFKLDIKDAVLEPLNLVRNDSTEFNSVVEVDWYGTDPNTFGGKVTLKDLTYVSAEKSFNIDKLELEMVQNDDNDKFTITSNLVDATIEGNVDFNTIGDNLQYQFAQILPAFFPKKLALRKEKSNFTYDINIKDLGSVLDIFMPDLNVANNTKIKGKYDGRINQFNMAVLSDQVNYKDYVFEGLNLDQSVSDGGVVAQYSIEKAHITDSLELQNVKFITVGSNNTLDSQISWNDTVANPSNIVWTTNILNTETFDIRIEPSFFTVKNHRWDLENASEIRYASNDITVDNFNLVRKDQFIKLNGCISENDYDKLNVDIQNLDLNDFSGILSDDILLTGIANADGELSNPFKNPHFDGEANVDSLTVNGESIGNVYTEATYNSIVDAINLKGNLKYGSLETLDFSGDLLLNDENNDLDIDVTFNETDIAFANALMDPDVLSNIEGLLSGALKVKGKFAAPEVDGKVVVKDGNVKLAILGANFGFDGEINANPYGFYIDRMPITDEEGNAGTVVGSISHDNFQDMSFDVFVNLEDDAYPKDLSKPWKISPLDKFLVMNTNYKEGDYYYGKAYVTGTASIFGYADNLEITVNAKSEEGTWVNFPMYGATEVEETGFVTFKSTHDTIIQQIEDKIDFTGVDMTLNIEATPDARLKLIFDPKIGDEITAIGSGNLEIKVDNFGDLAMEGVYEVKDGKYNFAMSQYKQEFFITEGGTVQWTGNPYKANLNISTYFKTMASTEILMSNVLDDRSSSNEEIYCFLNLAGDLEEPSISFDIEAPKASEQSKAVLNKIRSEQEVLQRQFFSLILFKKFQPLNGQVSAGGGAALELVATQLNSLINGLTKDYRVGVALDQNELTGDVSAEVGVSKEFLDDRLVVSGNFGVEENSAVEGSQNNLIGDVSVEYLLNESGSFRVNIFNESNDYSIVQDNQGGQFTQGVGLHYQEDFQNVNDFKLVQYIADLFRKEKKYKNSSNRKDTPIPSEYYKEKEGIKNENTNEEDPDSQ